MTARKQRILFQGKHKAPTVFACRLLRCEGLSASRQGVVEFLKRFDNTGTIKRKPGSRHPSKVHVHVHNSINKIWGQVWLGEKKEGQIPRIWLKKETTCYDWRLLLMTLAWRKLVDPLMMTKFGSHHEVELAAWCGLVLDDLYRVE